MSVELHEGDCLAVIPELADAGIIVDAVITDPPYHLTATAKRFSARNAAPVQYGKDGAMARLSGGFMGQTWDGGDVAFRPETWATIATLLRPGGFLLAFGGTRTAHRMVCAIEDAGFVIQDTIMWLYGSGFPKRRDMLKPAWEPICVAYKPGGKRALQVDECRIGNSKDVPASPAKDRIGQIAKGDERGRTADTSGFNAKTGRWPANVCHDGSDEVMEAFAAFGESKSPPVGSMGGGSNKHAIYGDFAGVRHENGYGDDGTAARFFYCAKAGTEERRGSRHPTVKPVALLKWLIPLVTPKGGTFLDPFAGSGTAAVAALATGRNAILIEREADYCADIRERIAHYRGEGEHSLASKGRHRQTQEGSLL